MIHEGLNAMPADDCIIRQFMPEDAEAASTIVCSCLRLDPMVPASARDELILMESPASMIERSRLFYMAVSVHAGCVAGVAGVDMNEIRLLFVDPGCQRLGIGSRLLQHLEALVPPALFGDVFVYSALGAVGFYREHGYRPEGEHSFVIAGHTVPTIFMKKVL
jgi:GNAT superfamily N-acetyltransferase